MHNATKEHAMSKTQSQTSTAEEEVPNDMSRSEIYEMFVPGSILETPQKNFVFPDNVDDGKTYGIDISHHQGDIDWSKVKSAGANFCYAKATEGKTHKDSRFLVNHEGARQAGLLVGAYHFLSHGTAPADQAENFLSVYMPVRGDADLPPVLDLEWDPKPGTNQDRWIGQSPKQIVDKCVEWLTIVESKLGSKPLIYTNKNWWDTRLGNEGQRLAPYKIWMSRYGAFNLPAPPMPDGLTWAMWQFTEHGRIPGTKKNVDVNFVAPDFGLGGDAVAT
jgi:lysozyme